ncbi:MAG TPA: DUF885 family protein [Vicinamibacterales bacterium]|nr:DUF885 family protein [Vicinamibacterales bacterium]
MTRRAIGLLTLVAVLSLGAISAQQPAASSYQDLATLFNEWSALEKPPIADGAPDYTATTIANRHAALKALQTRLEAMKPDAWPVDQQIDYTLLRAQMNGLDFYMHVLQPWVRDPAFYQSIWTEQSDTPAHEGPTHHAVIDLWTYTFPLSPADEATLTTALRGIAPLLRQAQRNLTGNARDLWITGTGTMRQQVADLADLAKQTSGGGDALKSAISDASAATTRFVSWLDSQASKKVGPSGIGREQYTWSLQNVHLVPMTWEDEVVLLKRELARAHASLKLEEQRNRGLPPLKAAATPDEYAKRANAAVTKYMAFLKDKDLLSVEDYLDPALRVHIGGFAPEATRNFFGIASHFEPMTLFAHFYHWFDHAWMKAKPHASAMRRGSILYNAWDNRSEGMATAMEEIILHAGYYDDNPRAREIVWIMLAQRCARGLASLYAQANEFDIKQAKAFQVEWTPRGWMRPDLDLLGFEQQLYLRQPGYGTSYVTGKSLIDDLIKNRAHQLGDGFTMRRFFDEFNAAGMMPVTLIKWQMTGERYTMPAGRIQ